MERLTIKEMKSLDYYFYYSNGRLIKTTNQHSQLPIELFENKSLKDDSQLPIFFDNGNYYLNSVDKSIPKYNGIYKHEIYSILNNYDYVSQNKLKELFVGYKNLNKERLSPVNDVTFLTSISTEQKIELFDKLFNQFNLRTLEEDSHFNSIPIPSLLTNDLIVAENNREVRLQYYFKSLEHHLNKFNENERWIVVDSFDLLNQKFADYFSTDLLRKVENLDFNLDASKKRFPDDLKKVKLIYDKSAFGYSGYLKNGKSSQRITSTRFGITKLILKEILCKELFARYVQNSGISPVHTAKKSAESLEIFNLENLYEIGVFLFCFTTGREYGYDYFRE